MEIQRKQIELITIIPNDGMYLTQANRGENEPIMSEKVILGKNDSPENWVEIPISEGDSIVAQWQIEQERKMRLKDVLIQEQQITDTTINTLNNSINYIPPMEIFKGNKYIQDGITYECIRNSEKQLDNNLCDLIGLYVYKV